MIDSEEITKELYNQGVVSSINSFYGYLHMYSTAHSTAKKRNEF